jgi:hypothetical protein
MTRASIRPDAIDQTWRARSLVDFVYEIDMQIPQEERKRQNDKLRKSHSLVEVKTKVKDV